MLRLVGTIGLALALVLWATPSVAQGVTMPKVTHEVPVTYPRSAIDEGYFQRVEVILELVVDATGTVTNAKVDTPRGYGFDEAAVTAARASSSEAGRIRLKGFMVLAFVGRGSCEASC